MTQWQPIETAPTDETEILITDGKTVSACVYFKSNAEKNYPFFARSSEGEPIDIAAGVGHGFLEPDYFEDPTHWMPMPTPPEID
jgi:hypothetical protein